jgi:hypothetical protein
MLHGLLAAAGEAVNLFPELDGATFSGNRRYRYRLWRTWDPDKPIFTWCMCNPSDADEVELDPTLRKVRGFTQRLGGGGFVVVNLFAIVSSDPSVLKTWKYPVGSENDKAIVQAWLDADRFIAGWGTVGGVYHRRVTEVLTVLADSVSWKHGKLQCLRTTKDGHPEHPLYVPYTVKPRPWAPFSPQS